MEFTNSIRLFKWNLLKMLCYLVHMSIEKVPFILLICLSVHVENSFIEWVFYTDGEGHLQNPFFFSDRASKMFYF